MDLIALLISALSLFVAVGSGMWAVVASGAAKRDSQKAIQDAYAANQLSAESNTIARTSQGIAVEANEISEEALSVARRADLRESDTSNVHWEGDWERPGLYKLTNRGDDDARNVRIILTVDEEEVRASEEMVPGGGSLTIECPQARQRFREEQADYARKLHAAKRAGPIYVSMPSTLEYSLHVIRERVDWVSEQGKPGSHDKEYRLSSLGDFD